MNDGQINRWGSLITIAVFLSSLGKSMVSLLEPSSRLVNFSGMEKLQTVIFLGLAAAAAHGILWSLVVETITGWKFGAGGDALPQGWSAIIQSLTMTIPLVFLPSLYAKFMHIQIVQPGNRLAACLVVVCAAIGHVLLYGVKKTSFVGIRRAFYPLRSPPNRWRALTMELIYALIHFGSIVLVYRVVVDLRRGTMSAATIFPAAITALLWLSFVSIFISLKYPGSLTDRKLIEQRGFLNGLMLMIALEVGMLM